MKVSLDRLLVVDLRGCRRQSHDAMAKLMVLSTLLVLICIKYDPEVSQAWGIRGDRWGHIFADDMIIAVSCLASSRVGQ
jgi:hypothetical protein